MSNNLTEGGDKKSVDNKSKKKIDPRKPTKIPSQKRENKKGNKQTFFG